MIKSGFIVGGLPFVIDEVFAEFSSTDGNAYTVMDEIYSELSFADIGTIADEVFAEFVIEGT
jgi:2C-methyl-D-erythritol 2,4-cyclodiphosphate synthase